MYMQGRVAQWIEQQVPVLWVGGSNPSALISGIAKLFDFLKNLFFRYFITKLLYKFRDFQIKKIFQNFL